MNPGVPDASSRWSSHSPTRVRFGVGALEELGTVAAALEQGDRALIVTGRSAVETGLLDRCRESLRRSGVEAETLTDVTADPTVHEVNRVVEALGGSGSGILVAAGGGSVMDAGKAAGAIARGAGRAEDYLAGDIEPGGQSVPVVAVPTTAGTGAELSKGAIVTWPERSMKGGIRGDAVCPSAAVVDPSLTLTVPRRQVSITGFDVFAHAVETYISRRATPMTEIFSRRAVTAVCSALPAALEDPDSVSPRVTLSYHSMLMGYNLANASTCLPHRLQYPLGVETGTPHAWGLAALYPAWMEATHAASPDRFLHVATWMAEGLDRDPPSSSGDVVGLLDEFLDRIELRPTLSDAGLSQAECRGLAERAGGTLQNDPWWDERRDLTGIYAAAL